MVSRCFIKSPLINNSFKVEMILDGLEKINGLSIFCFVRNSHRNKKRMTRVI